MCESRTDISVLNICRLCTFLHLKKKRHHWAKGSTWLPATASCGIITGEYHIYLFLHNRGVHEPKVCIYLVSFILFRTYPQSLMHCYEVIPEGAVCKIYFDLEFHKPSNRGSDGKTMVSLLIQVKSIVLVIGMFI